ncbi:MAG TPA: hypothetical protein ENK05_07515 [Gammaproteobacteria bacterium]|nr:hypothetical protein [Gammaproteobacteria bacterium]
MMSFARGRRIHRMLAALMAASCACLHAYATPPPGSLDATPSSTPPQDEYAYDQVVAEIPLARAATAGAALAVVNVALHEARRRAQQQLCAGRWSPSGPVRRQDGPRRPKQPTTMSGKSHWYLQTLREARPLACNGSSRAQFFMEMSRYLPDWIRLRPAGQLTAFSHGDTVLPVLPRQAGTTGFRLSSRSPDP